MLLFQAFKERADGGSRTLRLDTGLMDTSAVYTLQTPWTCYLLTTEEENMVQISRMRQALIYTAVLLSLQSPHPPSSSSSSRFTEPTTQKTPSSLLHVTTAFIVRTIFCIRSHKNDALNFKKILIITFSLLTSEREKCASTESGKGAWLQLLPACTAVLLWAKCWRQQCDNDNTDVHQTLHVC